MAKRVRIFLGWLMIAFLVGACMPSFLTYQAIPTPLPGAINLFVAQTAAAAATQTALLAPPTFTPSFTPSPTRTASPTFSPTPTFIFKLSTPTRPTATKPTATIKLGGGAALKATRTAKATAKAGAGGARPPRPPATWSCRLVSQSPAFGANIAAGTPFTATWIVTNTGNRDWTSNSIDVVIVSGSTLAANTIYDTTCDTPVGSDCPVSVPMTAPTTSGAYTSNWTLRVGQTAFCPLSVTIIVP